MHLGRNCQRHLWLLSGTGEGPYIVKAFVAEGWKVTVSVVSLQASFLYQDLTIEDLKIGPLNGVEAIAEILKSAQFNNKEFDLVLDATHPFAELISTDLKLACDSFNQPLLRYERPYEENAEANFISDLGELSSFDLTGQRLLMAIGSRHLKNANLAARKSGANVYARVLPNPDSLRKALSSSISESNLAVFRPFSGDNPGSFEVSLCKKWSITGILCRQSGGITERLWAEICARENLDLWMLSRPVYSQEVEVVHSLEELLNRVTNF
tara:strand:+ start:888 stop:1691 length:804 start_codon:yes stop_codon:yes gene_type:complete